MIGEGKGSLLANGLLKGNSGKSLKQHKAKTDIISYTGVLALFRSIGAKFGKTSGAVICCED